MRLFLFSVLLVLFGGLVHNVDAKIRAKSLAKQKSQPIATATTRRNPLPLLPGSALQASLLSVLLPWLYFLSTSLNIANMPPFVNNIINGGAEGESKHVARKASSKSARVFGNMSGTDAFFTFLCSNFIGCLSDFVGDRRPFMVYSAVGLSVAYTMILNAKTPSMLYVASAIDGLSSCMFAQAQAYVVDCSTSASSSNNSNSNKNENENDMGETSAALSRFQGLAIGLAFVIGIPLASLLGQTYSLQVPLRLAIGLSLLAAILIATILPPPPSHGSSSEKRIKRAFNWREANPLGALAMLASRTRALRLGSCVYFLLSLAQSGIQNVWFNYLTHKFEWSPLAANCSFAAVGLGCAFVPQIIIALFGLRRSISLGLLFHFTSVLLLSLIPYGQSWAILAVLPFFSIGASTLPSLLGFLADQVEPHEVGALQGAADTARTISTAIGTPLISRLFGLCIQSGGGGGGALAAASLFTLAALLLFHFSFPNDATSPPPSKT